MKAHSLLLLKGAVIAGATAWVYAPVLHGTWLWDDSLEISQNSSLRSAKGLAEIWSAPAKSDYFPLKDTVQWIEWHLWGGQTLGYHLANICLHLLSALLIWRLLAKLRTVWARDSGSDEPASGAEWIGGLLFAVHPLAVESVAWIAELKNCLSLPLLLLSILAYIDFDDSRRVAPYLTSLALFVAALLCKTSVVMLPAFLLVYVWWRRNQITRRDLKAIAAFFCASFVLGLITMWFQKHRTDTGGPSLGGIAGHLAIAGLAIEFYLRQCVFPFGLLPIYPRWSVAPFNLLQFFPWLVFIAAAMGLWIFRRTPARHVILGLGFFLLNLTPVLGFVPMAYHRYSWVADHLAYVPLVGIAGLAGVAVGFLGWKPAGWIGLAAAVGLAVISHHYVHIFRSPEELWTYTVQNNPSAPTAHYNLGMVYLGAGRDSDALAQFAAALQYDPENTEARNNLGTVFLREGQAQQAVLEFERVLQQAPNRAEVHNNLGTALFQLRRYNEAAAHQEEAVRLRPDFAEAYGNLGNALIRLGRFQEAANRYAEAIRLNHDLVEAYNGLGLALAHLQRMPEAILQYKEALRRRPNYGDAHYNLSRAYLAENMMKEAREELESSERAQTTR